MQYIIEQLVTDINEMNCRYYLVKSTSTDYNFYKEVMPYVEDIDNKLEAFINNYKQINAIPYMTKEKINLLTSNIHSLSVECHFQRTSKKLFTEKLKSVQYDLKNILMYNV
ncbi:DUF1798 family protein [Staphylococcus saccharolyticus]|uniref:DUF1798 family protein n=1 Tax=Staphylococcus saccharolyticus TaxID=33028 RepID=UPI0032E04A33